MRMQSYYYFHIKQTVSFLKNIFLLPKYVYIRGIITFLSTAMKEKYELEFSINSSPQLLYQYVSDPSGLSEWFADNVNSRGEVYSFIWGDSEEKARVVTRKADERVRYRWLDEDGDDTEYYFEIKIIRDELTKDVTIIVTDFAEADEINESKQLWENQIMDLKQVLGSA